MGINLTKYSSLLKVLCLIPILTGILGLADNFLPNKEIKTKIVSKKESYRAKFDKTTYNIYFENNNDQFTQEIFNNFQEGDEVVLITTYIDEETKKIKKVGQSKIYTNSTSEIYFKIGISIVFILPVLAWIKKRPLSNKQSRYIIFIVVISFFTFIRIIRMQLN